VSGEAWGWAGPGAVATLAIGTLGFQSIDIDVQRAGGAALDEALRDNTPAFRLTLVAVAIASVLLVVFGAGLRRTLGGGATSSSLAADVAAAGCLLTAAAAVVYVGLFGLMLFPDDMPPGALSVVWQLVAAAPAITIGLAASQVAVAFASLRDAALPRSIGWVAGVCAVVSFAVAAAGVPFLAYLPAFMFLLVTGLYVARRSPVGASV
jgi:hypothetical protein